jgi:hypothetical protein
MVLMDLGEVMGTVRDIVILLAPIAIIILGILVKKGTVSKENAEKAETVIRVLGGAVETFKMEDKGKSKQLTELIAVKARGEKIQPELDKYLSKFNLNNGDSTTTAVP